MAETAYVHCGIINRTKFDFVVKDKGLSWGKWGEEENDAPVKCSRASHSGGEKYTAAFKSCGNEGSASGAEGWVTYSLVDKNNKTEGEFKLKFCAPYSGGTNYVRFEHSGNVVAGPEPNENNASGQGLGFTSQIVVTMPPVSW